MFNRLKKANVSCFTLLLVLLTQTAWAENEFHYDRINLSVEANADVENDTLVAVLYSQREGNELALLSGEVNAAILEAINRSKKIEEVKVQTLAYQTNPTYQNQRLSGWRVRQSLQLESRNMQLLSKLIGDLQNTLALESLNYRVSMEMRSKVEENLIAEAIASFKKRAQLITQHLDRSTFRLVNMDVQTSGVLSGPIMSRGAAMMMEASVAPPAIEPGTQNLRVIISGVIELAVN